MKRKEILPILYARESFKGESIHLHQFNGKAVLVGYKGERRWLEILTERVPNGTYNQEVVTIPYIVIDGDVYPLKTFTEVSADGSLI